MGLADSFANATSPAPSAWSAAPAPAQASPWSSQNGPADPGMINGPGATPADLGIPDVTWDKSGPWANPGKGGAGFDGIPVAINGPGATPQDLGIPTDAGTEPYKGMY